MLVLLKKIKEENLRLFRLSGQHVLDAPIYWKKHLIFKLPEMLLETSPVEQPVIHMKMAVFLPRNSPPEVLL